jgi:DNA-directed RNA polymerase subunit RPC12/RpoP
MAKEIKAIKCPQCGSTSKTEIKPDVYRCSNCQTEYYLDDDNVTVNYNHNYKYSYDNNNGNQPLAPQKIKGLTIVLVIIFAIVLVCILSNVVFRKDPVNSAYAVSSAKETEQEYNLTVTRTYLPTQPDLVKPIAIKMENRTYNAEKNKSKDGYYLGFYDVRSNKRFAEQSIGEPGFSGYQFDIKQFSDGNSYFVMDGELYLADFVKGKIINVSKTFFAGYKELQAGIATVAFVYDDFGDGLIIMTNDGKTFYLYPLAKKLYTEDEFYEAQSGFNTLLPGAKEMTMYVFTGKSNDYPNEKQQLLKVRYKDNGGGPKDLLDNVSWGKDYGGSGIFTERDPYNKVLVSPYNKIKSRILDWKDITPGRYYFSPEVLYGSGNGLLIQFKADANPKSGYRVQQISTQTGQPVWTKSLGNEIVRELTPYKSGYVAVTRNDSVIVMDFNGKIQR